MSDESSKTITARFETREAADLALEHLTQEHGINRADIFIQAAGRANTSGTTQSGGDAPSVRDATRQDAALEGEIELSADIPADRIATVQRILGEAGALHVSAR